MKITNNPPMSIPIATANMERTIPLLASMAMAIAISPDAEALFSVWCADFIAMLFLRSIINNHGRLGPLSGGNW